MRTNGFTIAAVLAALGGAALAGVAIAQDSTQAPAAAPTAPAPAAAPATAQAPEAKADPVIATVGGADIRMSDLRAALAGLPEDYRKLPLPQLYPMLREQLVDRKAVALMARKEGMQNDPQVQRALARSEDAVLENALLHREIEPTITEDKVKARYEATIAGKPGEQEAHARHILVDSEDEAKKLIAELKGGADFAKLAKEHSKDPGSADGGDLGWFKKDAMVPEFANAVFAMKPNEISDKPVHTQFGWHVIQVLGFRQAPPPSFEEARDQIRQQMIEEGVRKVVAQAREGLKVELFNPDGSPQKPAADKDNAQGGAAVPPPASGAAPTK
jgi:peptidyl-prolyl cis-trans isomerase C